LPTPPLTRSIDHAQEDNTFAHPLPQYPVQKPGRKLPTFQDKQEAAPAHIPAFLPAFPDKHTYLQTPKFPGHEADPAKQSQVLFRTGCGGWVGWFCGGGGGGGGAWSGGCMSVCVSVCVCVCNVGMLDSMHFVGVCVAI